MNHPTADGHPSDPTRNGTYRLGPNTTLLYNACSVEPRLDGWFRHGPTETILNLRYTRLPESVAARAICVAQQLGTLEVM